MRRAAGSAPAARPIGHPAAASPASAPASAPARSAFSGMRAAAAGAGARPVEEVRPSVQPVLQADPLAGRGEPPPIEAGWLAILNWACRGAVDADRDDTDLALKVWSGRLSAP